MKTFLMVVLANVVIVAIMALTSALWPLVGGLLGHGNSHWVAPLAFFCGFLIAGLVVRDANRDIALRAQLAIFALLCAAILLPALWGQSLGIPAWRVLLTFVLVSAGTVAARAVLGGAK